MRGAKMVTIGVDVGGTFTDFVVMDEHSNALTTRKVPSTPNNPSIAVLAGVDLLLELVESPAEITSFLHGSTITTNALIQHRGARMALLLTQNLRGIFQVQSQQRVGPRRSTTMQRPPALVDELDVFEIPERIDRDGEIIVPLDEDEVCRVARLVRERDIQSVAVCYLFSYTNQSHENRTREIILEHNQNCRVFCSSDVLSRIREWPRMSTTILDAYLEPTLVDYVAALSAGLRTRGITTSKTFLMESNGGVMPFSALALGGKAVHTLLSGPAAAVQAAKRLAEVRGINNLVTMDIGGTSCDVAFVQDGSALEITGGTAAGYDVFVPMLDIATIGAGGGTIARVDPDGRLQVGPASAGAEPGPAAYAKGGLDATITDADLVLGYLNPDYFLGGKLPLSVDLARDAITANIADPLSLNVEEAALSAVRINDVHMADAVRMVAAKAGVTLAECHLVACGGAGPVHGAAIADELGINEVLVPESPGVFAALGLLCTDVAQDYVRTNIGTLSELSAKNILENFQPLETKAIEEYKHQGFTESKIRFIREVDARYAGQGFEIQVIVENPTDSNVTDLLAKAFHERHRRIYGHATEAEDIELVSYRIRAIVAMPQYRPEHKVASNAANTASRAHRSVVFPGSAGRLNAAVIRRSNVVVGHLIQGPAIIEQDDTTTVVPPNWVATMDDFGTLVMTRIEPLGG